MRTIEIGVLDKLSIPSQLARRFLRPFHPQLPLVGYRHGNIGKHDKLIRLGKTIHLSTKHRIQNP